VIIRTAALAGLTMDAHSRADSAAFASPDPLEMRCSMFVHVCLACIKSRGSACTSDAVGPLSIAGATVSQ